MMYQKGYFTNLNSGEISMFHCARQISHSKFFALKTERSEAITTNTQTHKNPSHS